MFNRYEPPSSAGAAVQQRWMTDNPVNYAVGRPVLETHRSYSTTSSIVVHTVEQAAPLPLLDVSPVPVKPKGRVAPVGEYETHSNKRHTAARHDASGMVSTPPSTLTQRNKDRHTATMTTTTQGSSRMMSPEHDTDGIAGRLADLWSEYVGGSRTDYQLNRYAPQTPTTRHQQDVKPAVEPRPAGGVLFAPPPPEPMDRYMQMNPRGTPRDAPQPQSVNQRWMHRAIQTPPTSFPPPMMGSEALQKEALFRSVALQPTPSSSHQPWLYPTTCGAMGSSTGVAPARRSDVRTHLPIQAPDVETPVGGSHYGTPRAAPIAFGMSSFAAEGAATQQPNGEFFRDDRTPHFPQLLSHGSSQASLAASRTGSPGRLMSYGLEAARSLDERERVQRDHVRFMETQGRRNIASMATLEKPIERMSLHSSMASATNGVRVPMEYTMQPYHDAPPILSSSTSDRWTPLVPLTPSVVGNRTYSGIAHNPTPTTALVALPRMSPSDQTLSPWRREIPYVPERAMHIYDEEARNRRELLGAEQQVREAVCGVISAMQRHADSVARQNSIHRAMLITVADEHERRQKAEGLEAHVRSAVAQLFKEATTSLVATAYERITLYTRAYTRLIAEESRQRLDVIDAEVLSRRAALVSVHEAELHLFHNHSQRQSNAAREIQTALGNEAELRFGLLQDEDRIRSDRYSRWAHERSVLEHLERQRLSSNRTIHTRLVVIEENEELARSEVLDMEGRLRSTLHAYYTSVSHRHYNVQQSVLEREVKEQRVKELMRHIRLLEERETANRHEGIVAWECVVAALCEWANELSLQQELDKKFQLRKRIFVQMQQLEEVEQSTRSAIVFAEDAVHAQHTEWVKEMRTTIREERATAFARAAHTLKSGEAFARGQISDDELRGITSIRRQEIYAFIARMLIQCDDDEMDARSGVVASERYAVSALARSLLDERDAIQDREFRSENRRQERLAMLRAYTFAEDESRMGIVELQANHWDAVGLLEKRERGSLTAMEEARREAVRRAMRDAFASEHNAREELTVAESVMWSEITREEETAQRRVIEAARAAQRARDQQLRTAMMTLSRLEEVNRDVLYGAAARSIQDLETRSLDLWKKFEEEHKRLLIVLEARKKRTFEDTRKAHFNDESVQRSEVEDVQRDMWTVLLSQFELRRPIAQSNNPQVVDFLKLESKGRIDIEDLFTYERWNLTDLEAMSRDDVADGVAPLSLPRHVSTAREASTGAHRLHPSSTSDNEFAVFVEESFPVRHQPPSVPQSPHPLEWEYEDAEASGGGSPLARTAAPPSAITSATSHHGTVQAAPLTRAVHVPPRVPSKIPTTRPHMERHASEALQFMTRARDNNQTARTAPPAVPSNRAQVPMPQPTGVAQAAQQHLLQDMFAMETVTRKKLQHQQSHELAAIIQHNIDTLP